MSATRKSALPPPPAYADVARTVNDAITSRRSVRAFLPAPVPRALVEHILEVASRAPSGTNMQPWNVHTSARGHGLHTCPQAAFADYHKIIRAHLGIPEDQTVICGLSIGYEDKEAVANRLRTDRAPVSEFRPLYRLRELSGPWVPPVPIGSRSRVPDRPCG
jgi:nitroreductase